jgi:hypothetical protein
MAQAQHFEQGSNWKAKNAASIRLRVGDGKKHPVAESSVDPALTPSERESADARRQLERERLAREHQAREGRERGARRDAAMDAKHASKDHTPAGWVPANRRGFVDPLSQAADPRPTGPLPKRKKGRRRSRRELQ